MTIGGRPSILAGRKPGSNGSDGGKIIDGSGQTSPGSGQPGSQTGFGPSHDGISTTNGRLPSNRGGNDLPSNLPSYNQINGGGRGSPDTSSPSGRLQPIRSGSIDTSSNGYPDSGRPHIGTGLQPIDHSRKQSGDGYSKTHRPGTIDNGSGSSSGSPSTDVLDGLRNVFKLPPGLCLVRCDTLRPGQVLTPDQIRDAIESGGQPSKYTQPGLPSGQIPQIGTAGQFPQGGSSSGQYPQGGTPSGQLPQGQYPTGTISGMRSRLSKLPLQIVLNYI